MTRMGEHESRCYKYGCAIPDVCGWNEPVCVKGDREAANRPANEDVDEMGALGVECGECGGPVYMETCETNRGCEGHHWVLFSECQRCGVRHPTADGCLDCAT